MNHDIRAEQFQAYGQENGDIKIAVTSYENAYFELYRFRAPRPETFTIPVKLDREVRLCTFTKFYDYPWAIGYSSETTYLVRYRTGKKLHARRPSIMLKAEEFIPTELDLKVRRYARYGNHNSREFPVSWEQKA